MKLESLSSLAIGECIETEWSMLKAPFLNTLVPLLVFFGCVGSLAGDVEIDENGFRIHYFNSPYQSGETVIRVLLPDDFEPEKSYRVRYVLPVIELDHPKYGGQ